MVDPICANAVTWALSDGIATPLSIPVTPHGWGVVRWSSIGRIVDPGRPASGANEIPAAARSASVIRGRTNTWVKGIALFSLVYSQRYEVAVLLPVVTLVPNEKPARRLWLDHGYVKTRRVSLETCVLAVVFVR